MRTYNCDYCGVELEKEKEIHSVSSRLTIFEEDISHTDHDACISCLNSLLEQVKEITTPGNMVPNNTLAYQVTSVDDLVIRLICGDLSEITDGKMNTPHAMSIIAEMGRENGHGVLLAQIKDSYNLVIPVPYGILQFSIAGSEIIPNICKEIVMGNGTWWVVSNIEVIQNGDAFAVMFK